MIYHGNSKEEKEILLNKVKEKHDISKLSKEEIERLIWEEELQELDEYFTKAEERLKKWVGLKVYLMKKQKNH